MVTCLKSVKEPHAISSVEVPPATHALPRCPQDEGVVDFDDDGDRQHDKKRKTAKAGVEPGTRPQQVGSQAGVKGAASSGQLPGAAGKGRFQPQVRDSGVGAHQLPTNRQLKPGSMTQSKPGAQAGEMFMPPSAAATALTAAAVPIDKKRSKTAATADDGEAGSKPAKRRKNAAGEEGAVTVPVVEAVGAVGGAVGAWEALGLDSRMCQQLAFLKFEQPTRVQCAAVPPLLAGRDVLVRAATGSGKTLAYLVPCVHDLGSQVSCGGLFTQTSLSLSLSPSYSLPWAGSDKIQGCSGGFYFLRAAG